MSDRDHWDEVLARLESLGSGVERADVRERLCALEAAIGVIGVQLGRVVVQIGEVRAMLEET